MLLFYVKPQTVFGNMLQKSNHFSADSEGINWHWIMSRQNYDHEQCWVAHSVLVSLSLLQLFNYSHSSSKTKPAVNLSFDEQQSGKRRQNLNKADVLSSVLSLDLLLLSSGFGFRGGEAATAEPGPPGSHAGVCLCPDGGPSGGCGRRRQPGTRAAGNNRRLGFYGGSFGFHLVLWGAEELVAGGFKDKLSGGD